jgi:hypothetical protein
LIYLGRKWCVKRVPVVEWTSNNAFKVVVYGKGQSQIIPKLRGTFEPPVATSAVPETTELQKSIFNAPPSSMTSKPVENGTKPPHSAEETAPHGLKRPREELEEEEEAEDEVSMEEDDDDAPMEEDEDD